MAFPTETVDKCAAEQASTVIEAAGGSRLSAAPQWDPDRTVSGGSRGAFKTVWKV